MAAGAVDMDIDGRTRREQLIADGLVQPAARPKQPAPEPVQGAGPVSDLVAEQRR